MTTFLLGFVSGALWVWLRRKNQEGAERRRRCRRCGWDPTEKLICLEAVCPYEREEYGELVPGREGRVPRGVGDENDGTTRVLT